MQNNHSTCDWDKKKFVPRKSGKPQKFCCRECSNSFQQGKRDYAQQELDCGTITIEDIKAAHKKKRLSFKKKRRE